ncbi:15-hydroxyprostaglandin dehydrogenase [Trichonephila clavipes]|nr:15-hydroxyprostaglandin dehydrogenase [Trichonephila clavipes]
MLKNHGPSQSYNTINIACNNWDPIEISVDLVNIGDASHLMDTLIQTHSDPVVARWVETKGKLKSRELRFAPRQKLEDKSLGNTSPIKVKRKMFPDRGKGATVRKWPLSSGEKRTPRSADGATNLEQPTLNHVQSDTMASAILADLTRALQETNLGSGPAMEESENDVGSLEQLLLYADEHYLAGKLPLGDHLGKVLHGVEEYHQRNVGPLRFHASQLMWSGYHRL